MAVYGRPEWRVANTLGRVVSADVWAQRAVLS